MSAASGNMRLGIGAAILFPCLMGIALYIHRLLRQKKPFSEFHAEPLHGEGTLCLKDGKP